MRYAGQGTEILCELPDGPFTAASVAELRKRFEAGYRALFNRVVPGVDVEVTGWDLARRGAGARPRRGSSRPRGHRCRQAVGRGHADAVRPDFSGITPRSPSTFARTLKPGSQVQGPAVIAEDETTTIVTSAFVAVLDPSGAIRLTAKAAVLQEAAQ